MDEERAFNRLTGVSALAMLLVFVPLDTSADTYRLPLLPPASDALREGWFASSTTPMNPVGWRSGRLAPDSGLPGCRGASVTVLLFLSAGDALNEGRLRIVNRSAAGEIRIHAVDDTGQSFGPVTMTVAGTQTVTLSSNDLETGHAAKGLPIGLGSGEGDWRLVLESELNLDVFAYARSQDGVVSIAHNVAAGPPAWLRSSPRSAPAARKAAVFPSPHVPSSAGTLPRRSARSRPTPRRDAMISRHGGDSDGKSRRADVRGARRR